MSPVANPAGWHKQPVSLDVTATDDGVGVKEIHVLLVDEAGLNHDTAVIEPGDHVTVPLDFEGDYNVRYFAVDLLGNRESMQTLPVRVDRTAPTVSGLPASPASSGHPTSGWSPLPMSRRPMSCPASLR